MEEIYTKKLTIEVKSTLVFLPIVGSSGFLVSRPSTVQQGLIQRRSSPFFVVWSLNQNLLFSSGATSTDFWRNALFLFYQN